MVPEYFSMTLHISSSQCATPSLIPLGPLCEMDPASQSTAPKSIPHQGEVVFDPVSQSTEHKMEPASQFLTFHVLTQCIHRPLVVRTNAPYQHSPQQKPNSYAVGEGKRWSQVMNPICLWSPGDRFMLLFVALSFVSSSWKTEGNLCADIRGSTF